MSKQYPGGFITKNPTAPTTSAAPGIWTLDQATYYIKQGTWPTSGAIDPQFNYVTMLLHGDGTNGAQNNTFLDSSTNNFTITRNGNTTQGTWTPYGANWSNYFDGSGDTLNTASNAAFGFGSGAWTFEAWVYPTTSQTDNWIIATNDAGKLRMRVGASGYLSFFTDTGSVSLNSTTVVTVNAWSHVAICYDGTTLSLFQNGTRTATSTVSISNGSANACYIGSNTIGGGYWNGYISNARVVKGSAVYSGSTYTVPTAPLTAISGTSLLTCADNRFIDDSTNNFTITKNGDVSVQRFSPFAPTSAYSTSVIGGSGYFDGSGDYLVTPSSALISNFSGDFTIEGWVYLTATTAYGVLIGGNGSNGWYVEYGSARGFGAYDGSTFLNGSSTAVTNQWVNFAVTRASGTVRFFINGTLTASTSSANFNYTQSIGIGAYSGGSSSISGYLSNVRVNNTTALYTASFTPSTTPLTAVSNTQLLCNFTNAGILDNAMMNDLETVGNAQISTSVKKYGTGSIAFDATADRLVAASSPNIAFGTGDFTVEFWLNSNNVASANQRGVIQTSDTSGGLKTGYTTGIAIYQGGNATGGPLNGGLTANVAGTFLGSSSAVITTSTWYHIALVRSSGTSTIYVNGTSVGSASTTGNCSGQFICVGGYYDTTYLYDGYIDDLRITKGYARYTSNFTAPTAAFPDR